MINFLPYLIDARQQLHVGGRLAGLDRLCSRGVGRGTHIHQRCAYDAITHLAANLLRVVGHRQNIPPTGASLAGAASKREFERTKASTSAGAWPRSGQEPATPWTFSGATPDERRGASSPSRTKSTFEKRREGSESQSKPRCFGDDGCLPPAASGDGADSDALFEKSRGYWIKKSAEQRLAAFGRSAGCHYQLMREREVVDAESGSNRRRGFLAKVTFLNAQDLHLSSTPNPLALPARKSRAKRRTEGCSASLASPPAGESFSPHQPDTTMEYPHNNAVSSQPLAGPLGPPIGPPPPPYAPPLSPPSEPSGVISTEPNKPHDGNLQPDEAPRNPGGAVEPIAATVDHWVAVAVNCCVKEPALATIFQQRGLAQLTCGFLVQFLWPDWLRSDEVMEHARLYVPELSETDIVRYYPQPWRVPSDKSHKEFLCWVMIGLCSVDFNLGDLVIAACLEEASAIGCERYFDKLVVRELHVRRSHLKRLKANADTMMSEAHDAHEVRTLKHHV